LIDRREILAVATDLGLSPEIVEKDYVLGWLLKGIYDHPGLSPAWTFKVERALRNAISKHTVFRRIWILR